MKILYALAAIALLAGTATLFNQDMMSMKLQKAGVPEHIVQEFKAWK
jgi:hypothetical protein